MNSNTHDPHFYSYKLIEEPLPPHSEEVVDYEDGDIEEIALDHNNDGGGDKDDVLYRLNQQIVSLQNQGKKISMDVYGGDRRDTLNANHEYSGSMADGMTFSFPHLFFSSLIIT